MTTHTRTLHDELAEVLGTRERRKVANNTYVHRLPGSDAIAVQLHWTDVVTVHPNGTITLNSGGWHTYTTKERINRYLPTGWRLYQEDFRWLVQRPDDVVVEFHDGFLVR